MLGVIFWAQIVFLERAVGTRAFARIVDPSDQIIEIIFFPNAAQIRRKGSAHHAGVLADRVACQAPACLEQDFAVRTVPGRLFWRLWTGSRWLPHASPPRLDS